jgi:hypothetical protein
MVRLSGRNVGVEITTYQSGATVEDGSGRREAEGELWWLSVAKRMAPGGSLELLDESAYALSKPRAVTYDDCYLGCRLGGSNEP